MLFLQKKFFKGKLKFCRVIGETKMSMSRFPNSLQNSVAINNHNNTAQKFIEMIDISPNKMES